MAFEHSIRRYRRLYSKLLRLYSKPHYERFAQGMEQSFNDLLRERAEEERGLFGRALWMSVETSAGIIRDNMTFIFMQSITKRLGVWAAVVALILMVPLVAMQFTDEVVWDETDFIVAGILLFGSGLAYELVARKVGTVAYRAAVGVAVATALLLVWVNLAVGIIGPEDNPANLLYGGVLAVGIIRITIARFQPHGMSRALFVTALAQALVPMIALIIWKPQVTSVEAFLGIVGVLVLNTFFVVLFAGSALLFRRAARKHN